MAARSFLGAGDIYIDRIVNGVKQGRVGPIYANKLEIQPAVDTKQSTSKGRYDYGQVLETVNLQQPATFGLELKEVRGDVLVMAMLGTQTALADASGAMDDQALTVTKRSVWLELGRYNLADSIEVTDAAGTTTYVEGTDYKLNRPMGWLMVLAAGIDVDDVLKVSGNYAGRTGSKIAGAVQSEVRVEIVFDGINQADGSQVTLVAHEAVLSPDSAFDFLADDFGNVSLSGQLKTPAGMTEPFTVYVQDAE